MKTCVFTMKKLTGCEAKAGNDWTLSVMSGPLGWPEKGNVVMRELQPVKRGDLVRITLDNDYPRLYRARRSVRDIGNLRLCDLQPDPVSEANAMMKRITDKEAD